MDVTPPSSMQRFMIRVGLGKKKKLQQQSSLRHSRNLSRTRSRWEKGRPISAITAKESVKSAHDERPLARRSTSKSATAESEPPSLGGPRVPLAKSSANVSVGKNLTPTPQPKRVKSFFGTLTNKLRARAPARGHTRDSIVAEPESAELQSSLHRKKTSRAQPVSVTLPNDIVSRQRRAEALRSRGLLPSRPQALSAIEAEEDRRIDTLKTNGPPLLSPDSKHCSDAKEIAQSWRSGNSMWLTLGPMTPLDLVPEVLISPIGSSGDCLKLSTDEVDLLPSSPLDGSTSVSNLLPSHARHSPVPSIRAASPAGSNDEQEVRPSRPASLTSPNSEELTGLAPHSVIDSTRSEENFPVGKPQTEIVGDAEKQSSLLTPTLLSPSESPLEQQSHITKESQVLSASSSPRPALPSRGLEDSSTTPPSPRLPPSPRSMPSPQPAPSSPLPSPPDLSASPQISVPDAPPLRLCVSESDALVASPTSPTVPSLFCSSSSEISHSTVFTDNGESLASPTYVNSVKGRRANLSPVAVKSTEGALLCEEVIIETTESFPEDDLDPFAGPSSTAPADPKVGVSPASPLRRKPLAFLAMAKQRASTLDSSSNARISKSSSMTNLRRSMTSAFQTRARPLSPVAQSPPLSPISVTMHNSASILAEASLIVDDETRRLSELAFM